MAKHCCNRMCHHLPRLSSSVDATLNVEECSLLGLSRLAIRQRDRLHLRLDPSICQWTHEWQFVPHERLPICVRLPHQPRDQHQIHREQEPGHDRGYKHKQQMHNHHPREHERRLVGVVAHVRVPPLANQHKNGTERAENVTQRCRKIHPQWQRRLVLAAHQFLRCFSWRLLVLLRKLGGLCVLRRTHFSLPL